jgi:hypothetical protein
MKPERLPQATLRIASLLAPGEQRAEWLQEWQSELWYVPPDQTTMFCLGAFRDAVWIRRNRPRGVKPSRAWRERPSVCLAFLATLAALSLWIAMALPPPVKMPHATVRDLAKGCLAMLGYTCVFLPATRCIMGRSHTGHPPLTWADRLRSVAFLAFKVALVQPVMLGTFLALLRASQILPVALPLGVFAIWVPMFRWILSDQWRRCPVCLRFLTTPVRLGTPSHTLLEWYGAESLCSRGHGLRREPEMEASYAVNTHWLRLDDSWTALFSESPGAGTR